MARWARRCSYLSRRISRTCLINSLSVMSVGALLPRGHPTEWGQATDERSGSESAITIPGTGDQDAPESVIRIKRNERSGWIGTGDQDASEYALMPEPRVIKPYERLVASQREWRDVVATKATQLSFLLGHPELLFEKLYSRRMPELADNVLIGEHSGERLRVR